MYSGLRQFVVWHRQDRVESVTDEMEDLLSR